MQVKDPHVTQRASLYILENISPFVSLSQRRSLETEMKKQPRR